jgi:hypothetical protein
VSHKNSGRLFFPFAGFLIGLVLDLPAALAAFISGGGGHGDYWFAKILFPVSMASTVFTGSISTTALVAALLQFPIYGFFVGIGLTHAKHWAFVGSVLLFHAIMIAVCFYVTGSNFS